jgi:dephospho-CoA kinase
VKQIILGGIMGKIRIAITGGIGSGKSLALRYISEMGYPIFSCDEIYKDVIQSSIYIEAVAKAFPSVVVNGRIERQALAQLIFDEPGKRQTLNQIAHPLIMQQLFEQMNNCSGELVFAEVPLLYEGNFENEFDKIIYVYRNKQSRIINVMERDGLSHEQVEKRISSQFDPDSVEGEQKLKNSNAYILDNNTTPHELYKKIAHFIGDMKHLL